MKRMLLGATLLFAGCASMFEGGKPPQDFARETSASVADTYQCAFDTVTKLGYTMSQQNKSSATFDARKKVTSFGKEWLSGKTGWDMVTIAAYPTSDQKGSSTTLKITGGYGTVRDASVHGFLYEGGPSAEGQNEINQILISCAK